MKTSIQFFSQKFTEFKILTFTLIRKISPLLIFILQACGSSNSTSLPKNQTAPIPVRVENLETSNGESKLEASGKFTTLDETFLSFKTGGIISRIMVKEGDPVHKGQILAYIKTDEIDARVNQTKLSLAKAERDFNRYSKLYTDSVITREQLENFRTTRDLQIEQVKAAEFDRNYSKIICPENGFVLKKMASEGQQVGSGTPVLQVNGAHSSPWILQVGVSDDWWSHIQTGDIAPIQTDALPGQVLKGKVVRKSQTVDPTSGVNTIDLLVVSSPREIAYGMFGKAQFTRNLGHSNFRVPYEAVLDASGHQAFVFITLNNKTAHKIPVQLGDFNETTVLITRGLDSGGKLILAGSAYLSEGSPIKIVQ